MLSKKRDVVALEDESNGKKVKAVAVADDEAFCSDDELPEESFEERLSWRNDDAAFSDWKIVISVLPNSCNGNDDDKNSDRSGDDTDGGVKEEFVYNVHKNILAVGPRRSEYFVRLFENDGTFSESQDNTSRIELHELATKAFPDFLDYIYYQATKETALFTTENATALYTLAKYFDVRRLRHAAKKFCTADMKDSPETAGAYYADAKILQADGILEAATKYFMRNVIWLVIQEDSPFLHSTDVQFWIDLMEEKKKGPRTGWNGAVSKHIAAFCRIHSVSPEVFQQLTHRHYLKFVDPKAAVELLHLERQLVADNQYNHGDGELSCLQKRCVRAISYHSCRKDVDADLLQDLPHRILSAIILGLVDRHDANWVS
jgi:BTB/POZ domain